MEFKSDNTVHSSDIINDFLIMNDYHFDVKDLNDEKFFLFHLGIENSPSLTVYITGSDSDMVKIGSYLTHRVSEDKREAVLNTLNELNDHYRLVKFSLDEDNSVQAQYDFLLGPDIGAAMSIFTAAYNLTINIINQAIPVLMQTVWA